MKPRLVDSHCHLNLLDPGLYAGGVNGAVERAHELGVTHMLCAGINLESVAEMQAIQSAHDGVFLSVGVHPNEHPTVEPGASVLSAMARESTAIAIGETGLDYFRSEGDTEWQRARFRTHILAAKETGLPLIIHCRDAKEDTLRILEEEGADEVGGVMHCFVQDWEAAERSIELNFYISFSGIVTFKNAEELKEVAARVPLERMLVETDSPYLAPMPYRGKPNQPGFTRYVAEHIAELRGTSFEEIAEATSNNFFELFRQAVP